MNVMKAAATNAFRFKLMCVSEWKVLLLAVALFLSPGLAVAETLVLIQGFLGDGDDWRDSGITRVLNQAGWRNAGHLSLTANGVRSSRPPEPALRRYYTLDLLSYAPLLTQAQVLDRYIDFVREQHPYSALVLAGHSAGGVLARLYMVQHYRQSFAALVTIASPHLGTHSAELGGTFAEGAFGWLADLVGEETLDFHWGLIRDLRIERLDNLLGWLNHQSHPPAIYTSIVRQPDGHLVDLGNLLVPTWSQDMNHVYALHGRARTVRVAGGHGLRTSDGRLLVRILEQLRHV
jgi:triacylglycerol lipase